MYITYLIVIMLIVLAFVCVIQHCSNNYIYRKLHNKGTPTGVARDVALDVSVLISAFCGILVLLLLGTAAYI